MGTTFEQIDKTPPVNTSNDAEGFNPADYQVGAPTTLPKTDAEGNTIVNAAGGPGLCTDINDTGNCPLEIPPLPELQETR